MQCPCRNLLICDITRFNASPNYPDVNTGVLRLEIQMALSNKGLCWFDARIVGLINRLVHILESGCVVEAFFAKLVFTDRWPLIIYTLVSEMVLLLGHVQRG